MEIDWCFRQANKNLFHRIAKFKAYEILNLVLAKANEAERKIIAEALNQSNNLDPNFGDSTPLLWAFPDIRIIDKYIKWGADPKRLNFCKLFKQYYSDRGLI